MYKRDSRLTRHWRPWQWPRGLELCEAREEASRNNTHRKFMIIFQESFHNTQINCANMLKGWKTSYLHERSQLWSTGIKQNQPRIICKKMNWIKENLMMTSRPLDLIHEIDNGRGIYWISSRGQPTRGGPPAWELGVELTTPHSKKNKFVTKILKKPRTWTGKTKT
jgi:hypothetical protein